MDDSSSISSDNHPQNQIKKLVSKIQNITKFQTKDLTLFETIRDEFSQLSSDIIIDVSKTFSQILIDTSIKIMKKSEISSRDNYFLENLISLLIFMGFQISYINDIENTIKIFAKFSKSSDPSLLSLIFRLFHHINENSDELRQLFIKHFIPTISAQISSFLDSDSRLSIPFISFFRLSSDFLIHLSVNTYSAIQKEVNNLLNKFIKLLEIQPSNEADIQNVADLAHIQSKIIHIFLIYEKQCIPIPPFQSYISYLLQILNRIHPCYFLTIKQILFDIRLVLDLNRQNDAEFNCLLSNFSSLCRFKRFNQHLIDAYTVFIQHVYQSSTSLNLFTEKQENDLISFIINLLHYKSVPRFIRHNEFSFILNHIASKMTYFKFFLFTIDVDIQELIINLGKIDLNGDLNNNYSKINNVEYCILKVLEQLSKNCISNKFTQQYSLNELTGLDEQLFELTIEHILQLISLIFKILNELEKVCQSIPHSVTIEQFYELEKKAIAIDNLNEEAQKRRDQIMSQIQTIFSNMPYALAINIRHIYFTKDFSIFSKINLLKFFIFKFETAIPLIDSYMNYFLNEFPYTGHVFDEMIEFFTLLIKTEIEFKFQSNNQENMKNYLVKLITILKTNYITSSEHINKSFELIILISNFASNFIKIENFSSSLFTVNFVKDICQMSRFTSIEPIHILNFIKYASTFSKEILLLPVVVDILVDSIEEEPDLSIQILNQIYKCNKNSLLKHSSITELYRKSAFLLSRLEKSESRKILLKLIKNGVSGTSDFQKVPLDLVDLKKIEVYNGESLFSIKINKFINAIKQSANNQFTSNILSQTIISIFETYDMSYENRKLILNLITLLMKQYKNTPELVKQSILDLLSNTNLLLPISAHIFVSLFTNFDNAPLELVYLITEKIDSTNNFELFINEVQLIVDFNLFNLKYQIKQICTSLIHAVPIQNIDMTSLTLFSILFLSKPTSNNFTHYTEARFSELGYLPRDEVELILCIRDSLSSIDELLLKIPFVDTFEQIVLFELISKCECDYCSFFDEHLDDIHIVSFLMQSFPDIIRKKYDQIVKILQQLKDATTSHSANCLNRKQDGDLLLLINSILITEPNLVSDNLQLDEIFDTLIPNLFFSSNLLYRHQARKAIGLFGNLTISKLNEKIRSFFIKTLTRESFFNEDSYIDFSRCYESLLTFVPLFSTEIFDRIFKYMNNLKTVNSFNSLYSLFEFLSDEYVIEFIQKQNYFDKLIQSISVVYVKFPYYRKNVFDKYLLIILQKFNDLSIKNLIDNFTNTNCLDFFILLFENEKILELFKQYDFKDQIQIESIKQASLVTFLDQNTLDIFDIFIHYLKTNKTSLSSIDIISCSNILNYLIKSPDLFLKCILQILNLDSPLLLSLSRMIFKVNIGKFQNETFLVVAETKHSNSINEPLFNYFIAYYIKKNPDSLNFFIEMTNSQTSYITSSFFLTLKKKNLLNVNVEILKIYKNCQNDKARLKTLQLMSRIADKETFDKTLKYLSSYISFNSPFEVYDCLLNLNIPKDKELPKFFYNNFVYFRFNDNLFSSIAAFLVRNKHNMTKHFQNEMLVDLELRLHFIEPQHIPDSIDLFESAFKMIEFNPSALSHCKSYIVQILDIIQKHPTSSSAFLNLILTNSFKILKIQEDEAFCESILKFYQFVVERTPKNSPSLSIITSFLPQLSELLIANNDIEFIVRLLGRLTEITSENQMPNVMIALNRFSQIDELYQFINEMKLNEQFSLPIRLSTFKELITPQQTNFAIEFLSKETKKRSELLLKQISMIFIFNNLPQIVISPSFQQIFDNFDAFDLFDLWLQSDQQVLVDKLYTYLQNNLLHKFFNRQNIPNLNQILKKLDLNSLFKIIPLIDLKLIKEILKDKTDPILQISKIFAALFGADYINAIQFISNLKSMKIIQIQSDSLPKISFKQSFNGLKNLDKWDLDFLKEQTDFALSFNIKASKHLLNSRFFLPQDEEVLQIIKDKQIGLFELDQIICEDKLFDSFLSFMKIKINEPEMVLDQIKVQLNKLIKIIDDTNFVNYIILNSLKFPISMLIKKEFNFTNRLFHIKLSPIIFPKYHELYSKVRNSFLESIKQTNDDFELLSRKLISINEQHQVNLNNSIALYNGNESDVKSIEKDLERLVTVSFLEPLQPHMLNDIYINFEKLVKLNPVNDVVLAILASQRPIFDDEETFKKLLQLIKTVPFKWSQMFIDLIKKNRQSFGFMLPRIHKAFSIEFYNEKTKIQSLLGPFVNTIKYLIEDPTCQQIFKLNQDELMLIDQIRSQNENHSIEYELDSIPFCTFLKSISFNPIPPPLTDDQGKMISMKCYLRKFKQKYINVDVLLNNGHILKYILSSFTFDHRLSLLFSLLSNILQSDQRCSYRGQYIDSFISTYITDKVTLSYSNNFEPLYSSFLFKKLKRGVERVDQSKSFNFSTKASYAKYMTCFSIHYSSVCLIQSFLNKPTPSPIDIFINPTTASVYFLKFDENTGDLPTSFRLCGKMRKFLSSFCLNGPFLEGLVLSSTCFFMNQNKVSLLLESILNVNKNESFSFIEKCSKLSIHLNDINKVQAESNELIEKSSLDNHLYIIPWL